MFRIFRRSVAPLTLGLSLALGSYSAPAFAEQGARKFGGQNFRAPIKRPRRFRGGRLGGPLPFKKKVEDRSRLRTLSRNSSQESFQDPRLFRDLLRGSLDGGFPGAPGPAGSPDVSVALSDRENRQPEPLPGTGILREAASPGYFRPKANIIRVPDELRELGEARAAHRDNLFSNYKGEIDVRFYRDREAYDARFPDVVFLDSR